MSVIPGKRGRGRPKGSRNKRKALSTATVREICEHHKFNPAEKLIAIAKNDDWDDEGRRIDWTQDDQRRATEKLFDSIHNKNRLMDLPEDGSSGQITLAFIESNDSFALPGEAGAEVSPALLQSPSVQCAGLSSEDGQDGIRDQQTDP